MTEVLYIEVVFITTGIDLIWSNRLKSAGTSKVTMRAELQARAGLLWQARGRRLQEAGVIMANFYQSLFKIVKQVKIYMRNCCLFLIIFDLLFPRFASTFNPSNSHQ